MMTRREVGGGSERWRRMFDHIEDSRTESTKRFCFSSMNREWSCFARPMRRDERGVRGVGGGGAGKVCELKGDR